MSASIHRRKANTALGIFVITLLFGAETGVAHNAHSNPLSPLVWAVLAAVGVGALAAWAWQRRLERRVREERRLDPEA